MQHAHKASSLAAWWHAVTAISDIRIAVADHAARNTGVMHAVLGRLLSVAHWHSYPDWPAHRTARRPEARSHRCGLRMPEGDANAGQFLLHVVAKMFECSIVGMFPHRPHMHRLPATPGGQRCNRRCTGNMFAGVRGCAGCKCVRRSRVCFCLRAITSASHGELLVIIGGLPDKCSLPCCACTARLLAVKCYLQHVRASCNACRCSSSSRTRCEL